MTNAGLSLISVTAGYGETIALENIDLEIRGGGGCQYYWAQRGGQIDPADDYHGAH